jgi:chemotaxis protein methyltransferase CheR
MNTEQFDFLRAFLKKQSGLMLGEDKRYLIDSRLGPVAKEFGLASIGDMVELMRRPGAVRLGERVTEAMTINESFFFRDMKPFEHFNEIMLPQMLKARAGSRRLRIWSAAASTGQEAYSLAISLRERSAQVAGWQIEITGTDLSNEALARARAGLYSQFEVQRGMPTVLLMRYFQQQGSDWVIKPDIKSMVSYRQLNLLSDFRSLGQFDIVFCRNVLIYFDRDTKSDILRRIAQQMAPDGFLVLGAAETIVGLSNDFRMVAEARGLYQRSEAAGAQQPLAANGAATGGAAGARPTAAFSAPQAQAGKVGAVGSLFSQNRAALLKR